MTDTKNSHDLKFFGPLNVKWIINYLLSLIEVVALFTFDNLKCISKVEL